MTTTVKGAGRARHEANARHNQRTPLPPKGAAQKSPADLAAEDADRKDAIVGALAGSAGMTRKCPLEGCGRNHKIGSKVGATHAEAAERGQAVTVRPKPAAKASRSTATAVADAKPAEATGPAPKSGKRGTRATATVPGDAPGAAKAQRICDAAGEAGWETSVTVSGTSVTVSVSRGNESIETTLTDGKLDLSAMPTYTADGRSVKLKNVSAVLHQMAGDRPGLVKATRSTPAERAPRRTKTERAEAGAKALPFDPKASTDEEVLDAIRGHAIEWMNGISRKVEEAVVAATMKVRNPKYKKDGVEPEFIDRPSRIQIAPHPARETRVVTFTDHDGTGFRSVALDRLTAVK